MTERSSALQPLLPSQIRKPFAAYSHGVLVPAPSDMIFCSGQLGIAADDVIPADAAAQTELCFANIAAILAEGGMSFKDVVRINAYVTNRIHMAAYMSVRDRLFPAPSPASTLMIVQGFTRPEFKVEIEVIAARCRREPDRPAP